MIVLTCGTIILFVGVGARNIFGILLDPMVDSLGWSVADFSFAIALQAFLWGITTPITATLADRYGTGKMVAVGAILYATGLGLMALVKTPMEMNITSGLMIGFGLSATGFPIILAAVGKRVDASRRSLFLGISGAAGSSGQLALVPVGQYIIGSYGWITAVLAFAIIVALIVPLAAALADPKKEKTKTADIQEQKLGEALKEAFQHRGFVLLTTGYFVCGFQVMFLGTHLPNFLTEAGHGPWLGATALSLIGLFNIFGTLGWGALGGYWRIKYLLSSIYLLRSLVLTAFILLPITPLSTYVFSSAIGFLWLATVPLTSSLVAQVFGVRYMATLTGIVFFSHQLGSFFGVWLGGKLFVDTGSYDTVWWICVLLGAVAALLHYPINDKPLPRTKEKIA
tara:strand:- start:372 stop:1562 length:1191 start_codon:yes stop_codon:yes gene_type:complete